MLDESGLEQLKLASARISAASEPGVDAVYCASQGQLAVEELNAPVDTLNDGGVIADGRQRAVPVLS